MPDFGVVYYAVHYYGFYNVLITWVSLARPLNFDYLTRVSYLFWLLLYPISFALLYLRFDWGTALRPYSLRSYLISAVLMATLLPTVYQITKLVSAESKNSFSISRRVTFAAAMLLSFPFGIFSPLLNLPSHYSKLFRPIAIDWDLPGQPIPKLVWFPAAFSNSVIPYEKEFFLGFFLFALLVGILLLKFIPSFRPHRWLGFAGLCLICFQTWSHLSMRSPYTYIPHYEQPPENHYWYQTYLFPNQQGAVNRDIHVFLPGEQVFQGVPEPLAPLLSRSFPSYLASQGTAFFNSYYIWLVQNMLFWGLAALAIFYLALKFFDEKTATIAALLMFSSQEMIHYVAQPKVYATAICMLAIVLALQQSWFEKGSLSSQEEVGFIGILFLFFLSYESQPWVIGLIVFAIASKWNLKPTIRALFISLVLYYLYLLLCRHLPALAVGATQTDIAGSPSENIKKLILSGNPIRMLLRGLICFRGFGRCLVHCYQLVIFPAILGLFWANKETRLRLLALLVAPLLTYSYFELGENWYYIQFPRIVMLSYPAIYCLAAVGLIQIWEGQRLKSLPYPKVWVILFLCLNVLYLNADVWGNPWIYYLWFYRHPGFSFATG